MANSTATESPYKVAYITVETIIAGLAVLDNVLVIGAVKRNRDLRNVTFCCLVSLVLAVDRYLSIKIPTRYKTVTTKTNIWICLMACWLVSFVVGLVPMFGWNTSATIQANDSSFIQCRFTTVMSMDYMFYFNFLGWVLLPLLPISGLYLEIFYLLRKNLNRSMTSRRSGTFYGREYIIVKSLALVLFLFVLCWMPMSLINCLLFFWPHICHGNAFSFALYCSILLSHAHSAMNPVVYAFKIQKIRETYKDIACKGVFRKGGESMSVSEKNSLEPIS